MKPYLATRGTRAWDMMSRTCAIQVNVDFSSDEDLAKKFIVGNRLGPIVGAIFANSPFENGKPSGFKSTRQAAWLKTDPDRAGISPPALSDDFSVEAFVEYMLTVPMLFIRRRGAYLGSVTGERFSTFLENGLGGPEPIFQDWTDHLSTVFTEARLKQYIELRSADGGDLEMMMAAQALWKGLLYETNALNTALGLAPRLGLAQWYELQTAIARDGLEAHACGVNVADLAKQLVELAADGLRRIARDEVQYLEVLEQRVCREELTPADILLRNWSGSWHGSVKHLMDYLRITA
jgi:glutamate--cysteine ligase